MKISIVTPSVRPNFLPMVGKCLRRQTLTDFEWLIGVPKTKFSEVVEVLEDIEVPRRIMVEPEKREDDYYNLNKCWNMLFNESQGDLIVSIVDGLWFPPDTLERLWSHYESNPKACVTTIGHQYDQEINGKPENEVWHDPRVRSDFGSFYEITPSDLELCVASIPRKAISDVGGVDEEYDKYAAMSEKEMALRMDKAGYKFYIDQSIEYRAVKHPRLSQEWDTRYFAGQPLFQSHVHEIVQGDRLKLSYLSGYNADKGNHPSKELSVTV